MLQYILTGLAGVALGVVALRVWQMREVEVTPQTTADVGQADGDGGKPKVPLQKALLAGAGILVVAAIGIIALRGGDSDGGGPAKASPTIAGSTQALGDVDTMIERLAKRLEKEPNDGEGFRMLGWSYMMTGRPELALAPFKRAMDLMPESAAVHSGYGKSMVGAAHNVVTPEAKSVFEETLKLDPAEPRARYFLGLWKSQNGQEKGALEDWIKLAGSAPADAPWQSELRSAIDKLAGKLGVDVSSRLAPMQAGTELPPLDAAAVQAASNMPAGDRQAMIEGMVDGLAKKLKGDPTDVDGWIRLLRSRMVLGQADQAGKDLAQARASVAGSSDKLRKLDAAAAELGIPGA